MELFMQNVEIHVDEADDVLENVQCRRKRVFRPRINFDRLPHDAAARFRLRHDHIAMIDDTIGPYIAHSTRRNCALSSRQQIMLTLRFLATGDNFRTVADAHGVHKSTLSRTLHRVVTSVVTHLYDQFVDWPTDRPTLLGIVNGFREKGGMPSVFGALDGSHIDIMSPSDNEPAFVNRHGNHSINALVVSGPKLRFYYVDVSRPGSVSDARVFDTSTLKQRLQAGWSPVAAGVLLGDSGYCNTDVVITPLRNPHNAAEERFNRIHCRTRRFVECSLGVLKNRFRCLLGILPFKPEFCASIIQCCVILHNMLLPLDDTDAFLEAFDREENPATVDARLDREESTSDDESESNRHGRRRLQLIGTL